MPPKKKRVTGTYGTWIDRTSTPGQEPCWTRAQVKKELRRVSRDYDGATLKHAAQIWLDVFPPR